MVGRSSIYQGGREAYTLVGGSPPWLTVPGRLSAVVNSLWEALALKDTLWEALALKDTLWEAHTTVGTEVGRLTPLLVRRLGGYRTQRYREATAHRSTGRHIHGWDIPVSLLVG